LDALDECQNRGPFLKWLSNVATRQNSNVRLLLSSRREQDIESVLSEVPQIQLDASTISNDIKLMLTAETLRRQRDQSGFLARPAFREKVLRGVLEGSDGKYVVEYCFLIGPG
jgi:hypothetical protein